MKSGVSFFILCNVIAATLPAQTWNRVGVPGLAKTADNPEVRDFCVYNNELYVSGAFNTADGKPAYTYARWNGSTWDSLASKPLSGGGNDLTIYNDEIIYGGSINEIIGVPNTHKIARWNGSAWGSLNTNTTNTAGFTAVIYAMAVYKGELYAGGNITKIGGININRMAKWNGSTWSNVGGGVTGGFITDVQAMAVYNDELYVGGDFTYAGGKGANYIARWNGTSWDSVRGGFNYYATDMVVDSINNFLYVTGGFSTADGKVVKQMAGWDGEKWFLLDTLFSGNAYAMSIYHNELYAAGSFSITGINGSTIYLAKWDGKKWAAINGIPATLFSLGVYNDELYIGGAFNQINGDTNIKGIARYYSPPPTGCDYLQSRIFAADTLKYFGDSVQVQFENNNKYASSWAWSFGDGDTDTIQNPVHYYTTPGTYNVQVIVNYEGCIDTATTVVVIQNAVGINELKNENTFKVFPNPAKGEITIQIQDSKLKTQDLRIEIYDIAGKKVKDISEIKGNEVKISLATFSQGVYFVELKDKNGITYSGEKVIVQ